VTSEISEPSIPEDFCLKADLVSSETKLTFKALSVVVALTGLWGCVSNEPLVLGFLVPLFIVWCFMLLEPRAVRLDSKGITLFSLVFRPEIIPWSRFINISPTYINLAEASKLWTVNYKIGCFYFMPETKELREVRDFLIQYSQSKQPLSEPAKPN
jgi:hypothetical protein